MIIKRLSIYFLCFFIVYIPVRPARAFFPVVVGLTGQAAMWTGRTLVARMAVNYGADLGVLATAAVATTPMIKDYMTSEYALRPWGTWAYALEKVGFHLDGGEMVIKDDECFLSDYCGKSVSFKMADGSWSSTWDKGLYKTGTKLVCPINVGFADENGKNTLFDCGQALSDNWWLKYRSWENNNLEPDCGQWVTVGEEQGRKSCFDSHSIIHWGMSGNSFILKGEFFHEVHFNGELTIKNRVSINEIEVLFPVASTQDSVMEGAIEDVLDNEAVNDEIPVWYFSDPDVSYCGNDGCVDVPPQYFVDNTVVIPVDDNNIPIPPAIGLPPVSLPSDRPLPPIFDPIYGDAINSVISGILTGDPDTDTIAEDIIKPIVDGVKPIVDIDVPVDPPIYPPIDPPIEGGSVVAVSNLTGIESRLDMTNQLLENMNINVDVDMTGVEERIDRTNELIGGLSTTTVPISTTPDSSRASSFWTSNYPNGFQGVWNNFNNDFQNTALSGWVNSFKLSYVSEGIPTWTMCFDLGFVDFGCQPIEIDSRVWLAIRAFILFTAALLARRLVFGG
ncbi:hypothetical protein [Vibrio maritimus]|uniref:hypothetical protein n=1 Tax=Vibrio maritimus TaxID=990268 RepID=UPI001F250379|nr:hypothetical protein [Vibrio maritimus]